jgi:hypothetical protein
MSLDKDFLNADWHYLRAKRLGNRHDSGPLQVTKGTASGWITFTVWLAILSGAAGGIVLFWPKILQGV